MAEQPRLIVEFDEVRAKKAVETAFESLTGFPLKNFGPRIMRRFQRERGYGMVFAAMGILATWGIAKLLGRDPNAVPVVVMGLIGGLHVWQNR